MSRSVGWSFNSTEGGFPSFPRRIPLTEDESHDFLNIAELLLGILSVVAITCLSFPSVCNVMFRCNRQYQDQDQAQDTAAPPPAVAKDKEQRKGMRYAEIYDNPKELKHGTSSVDTVCTDVERGSCSADEERECPICMDAFEVEDLVSWSPNAHCEHVFHHSCIQEWLLKRKCCPCCRQIFLPVNQVEGLTKSKGDELFLAQQQLAAKTFFCIHHGVVTLCEPELCFTKKCELEQMLNKIHRVPSQTELAATRGYRNGNIESPCEVDGCIPGNVALNLSEDEAISTTMIYYSIDEELAEPHTSSESTDDSTVVTETPGVQTDEEHAP